VGTTELRLEELRFVRRLPVEVQPAEGSPSSWPGDLDGSVSVGSVADSGSASGLPDSCSSSSSSSCGSGRLSPSVGRLVPSPGASLVP